MIEIKSIGDLSIQVSFGSQINEEIHREIQHLLQVLKNQK